MKKRNPMLHILRFNFMWSCLIVVSAFSSLSGPSLSEPFLKRSRWCVAQRAVPRADDSGTDNLNADNIFYLRDAQYSELKQVVDIIMSSFYTNSTTPWKQLFGIAELNRIQQGFPHIDRYFHRNIVAVARTDGKEKIVGFCDLDDRIPNRPTGYNFNPRPYVSDLCISPEWRRKGIAKAMIRESETYSRDVLGKDEIFIRVESSNQNALKLYESMGYQQIDNPDSPKKQIHLMRKELSVRVPEELKSSR